MNDLIPSDAELFAEVKLNNIKAFDLLYERYWPLIYKKCFSYLHDSEPCGEIVNDIFLNIWKKRHVLNIITFKSYLTASARYRTYNYIKTNKSSPLTYVEDYEKLNHLLFEANNGENKVIESEVKYHVGELLNELPKKCKEIFLLSRNEHLSNKEIAYKLSISKRTVENQVTIALKHLRIHLRHPLILSIIFKLLFQVLK